LTTRDINRAFTLGLARYKEIYIRQSEDVRKLEKRHSDDILKIRTQYNDELHQLRAEIREMKDKLNQVAAGATRPE
jgi:prefoldin subunit 5